MGTAVPEQVGKEEVAEAETDDVLDATADTDEDGQPASWTTSTVMRSAVQPSKTLIPWRTTPEALSQT